MSFFIQTLIAGVLALIVYPFSPPVAGWLVWSIFLFFSVGLFFKGLEYRKRFLEGESLKVGDIMGAATIPAMTVTVIIALAIFLFVDISKLHLLWIVILIGLFYELPWSKRWVRTMEPEHSKNQKSRGND